MLYEEATIQRVLRAARADQDWRDVASKNDVNLRTAYRWIATARETESWDASPRKSRGGKRNSKVTDAHVDYLLGLLDENCYLTLDEMVDALEAQFALKVSRQTVKHHVDGRMYTIKQTHRDNIYRNLPKNKILRRDYVVNLFAYKADGKKIFYVDETNVNLLCTRSRGRSLKGKRAVDKNTASKGSNIHVIACIAEDGLAYSEKRFGSFKSDKSNEFMRCLLTHIATTTPLHNVVIDADNAPCHTHIEDVFDEEALSAAEVLRLGPYPPMVNPIENCFSTLKAMVTRFLARHRLAVTRKEARHHKAILQVPPHRTIKDHREEYLKMAADLLVNEAITPYLCHKCALHIVKFHALAIQEKDMPVGE